MNGPHCAATSTKERGKKTKLGYRAFRCSACKHLFNERTGTPFNYLEFPTDIVLLVMSKTTVVSNSGTIPCVVLEPLKRRHASVVPLMNYATISVPAAL